MASRELTAAEREHWEEATKDARRAKARKRVAKAVEPAKSPTPKSVANVARPLPIAAHIPPKKKTAAAPLPILPRREGERLLKPHARTHARIDLHGMTQDEAHEALIRFITRCYAAGKRHVAVITGKGSRGEGVLKRAVPRWLELPELRPMVAGITHASPEKGGDGVLHVLLKKPS